MSPTVPCGAPASVNQAYQARPRSGQRPRLRAHPLDYRRSDDSSLIRSIQLVRALPIAVSSSSTVEISENVRSKE
jgi:hypothetical protein